MSTAPRNTAVNRDWGDDFTGCTILHIDMDAFYASCEIARHPELRGKPVIIGTGARSVVSTASYEARAYGINSAMPTATARRLCPRGIFLPVDMPYYRNMSARVCAIFREITDRIEKASVDEGYMDVSGALLQWHDPRNIAQWIRSEVSQRIGVTCSVGIASNKLIAKLASTNAKPDGMLMVSQTRQAEFIQMMNVRSIPGVGPATAKSLEKWGITTVKQLAQLDESSIAQAIKSSVHAHSLFLASRGLDDREVVVDAPEKSIGTERTLREDTTDFAVVKALLFQSCDEVASTLRKRDLTARTISVKVRYSDLRYASKALTLDHPFNTATIMRPCALQLFKEILHLDSSFDEYTSLPQLIRLAGVTVSNLQVTSQTVYQLSFDDFEEFDTYLESEDPAMSRNLSLKDSAKNSKNRSSQKAEKALDSVRKKFGKNSVSFGI